MPWFRSPPDCDTLLPIEPAARLEVVRNIITAVTEPRHFRVAASCQIQREQTERALPWELYRGRLVDSNRNREQRHFETWDLFWIDAGIRSPEPVLAVLLDPARLEIHIVRAIYSYAWEAYDAGDNVILSREVTKWLRELVGNVQLKHYLTPAEVSDELLCQLFQAVVGTSRLALTSTESPLPVFSLGQLAYEPEATDSKHLNRRERVKRFEFALRQSVSAAETRAPAVEELPELLRAVFDEVALTPYTAFVDHTLAFLDRKLNVEQQLDFLGGLLRSVCRHLTAYDLIRFHHRGANYPDALLLDAVFKRYLLLLDREPDRGARSDTTGQLRRRALRQGWLLRRFYEGLAVPDEPTSPGENARILPPPHLRVPDEQLNDPRRRHRRLFVDEPTEGLLGEHARELLRQSVEDLGDWRELRELGVALFLNRPFGCFKEPLEADQTLLCAHEAFSPSIAERRVQTLLRDGFQVDVDGARMTLGTLAAGGLPLAGGQPSRPGIVSLADANLVAEDLVVLHTRRRSLREFREQYDLEPVVERFALRQVLAEPSLLLPGRELGKIVLYDAERRPRVELEVDASQGYRTRGGVETLRVGLRVSRAWTLNGLFPHEENISGLRIKPR